MKKLHKLLFLAVFSLIISASLADAESRYARYDSLAQAHAAVEGQNLHNGRYAFCKMNESADRVRARVLSNGEEVYSTYADAHTAQIRRSTKSPYCGGVYYFWDEVAVQSEQAAAVQQQQDAQQSSTDYSGAVSIFGQLAQIGMGFMQQQQGGYYAAPAPVYNNINTNTITTIVTAPTEQPAPRERSRAPYRPGCAPTPVVCHTPRPVPVPTICPPGTYPQSPDPYGIRGGRLVDLNTPPPGTSFAPVDPNQQVYTSPGGTVPAGPASGNNAFPRPLPGANDSGTQSTATTVATAATTAALLNNPARGVPSGSAPVTTTASTRSALQPTGPTTAQAKTVGDQGRTATTTVPQGPQRTDQPFTATKGVVQTSPTSTETQPNQAAMTWKQQRRQQLLAAVQSKGVTTSPTQAADKVGPLALNNSRPAVNQPPAVTTTGSTGVTAQTKGPVANPTTVTQPVQNVAPNARGDVATVRTWKQQRDGVGGKTTSTAPQGIVASKGNLPQAAAPAAVVPGVAKGFTPQARLSVPPANLLAANVPASQPKLNPSAGNTVKNPLPSAPATNFGSRPAGNTFVPKQNNFVSKAPAAPVYRAPAQPPAFKPAAPVFSRPAPLPVYKPVAPRFNPAPAPAPRQFKAPAFRGGKQ